MPNLDRSANRRLVDRLRQLSRKPVRGLRRPRAAGVELVRRIRSHDLSDYSDTDLRDAIAGIKSSIAPGGQGPDQNLSTVFAIVDESVSRRLGAWRLFDTSADHPSLAGFRRLADQIDEAGPYKSRVAYYTDQGFLESPAFRRSLEPLLAEMDLDRDERTIVATMVYVAEASKVKYWWDILLPSEFYQALRAKDAAMALTFQGTDEQLLAGYLLYKGRIVEMNAGEGKTIAAAFPAVLHAVAGRPVHIITANDYLADRDAEWLAPVYESLGLGVRAVLGHTSDTERKDAYEAQIVYGTLRELGFDFLRDNLRRSKNELIQGPLDVAIVDEADQALIDEARAPLIISGRPAGNRRSIHKVRKVVETLIACQAQVVSALEENARRPELSDKELRLSLAKLYLADPKSALLVQRFAADVRLRRRVQTTVDGTAHEDLPDTLSDGLYYTVDARRELVTLTDKGQDLLERYLGQIFETRALERELQGIESDDSPMPLTERRQAGDRLRRRLWRRLNQMNQVYKMLHACLLLTRDVDYMVTEEQIVLIDKVTGRGRPDSRYLHGLQNALEAKEGLTVQPESEALAQISVQGFIKQYSQVAGMTGTALPASDEFRRSYGLKVAAVPPSHPYRRTDFPARLYITRQDKLLAVLDEVKHCRQVGRPVLVGTLTVEQSEEISRLLERHGVEHRLLNAVNNGEEARVVKSAGTFGAVTVATNMAGRGTDIILEPGLDLRITDRYVMLVRRLLSEDTSQVVLSCATSEESQMLEAALAALDRLSVVRLERDGYVELLVTPLDKSDARDGESTRRPRMNAVHLEFGLGLYVIGTEMNESSRIDSQLRGRGGRQGEHSSSRSILSMEDRALLFTADTRSAASRELRSDAAGRAYLQGTRTDRLLGEVQAFGEMDDELSREVLWDFSQVIERQTLSFYRDRREVMESDFFHVACLRFMREKARRLVDRYLPPAMVHRYASQFEAMAEELWLDYGVDSRHTWGLGIDALKDELERLMTARLEDVMVRSGAPELDEIEKHLYLQTSDELWVTHLSRLYDLMNSTALCTHGHKAAVAEYVFGSLEARREFEEEVIDTFLPRLLAYAASEDSAPHTAEVSVVRDVHEILV